MYEFALDVGEMTPTIKTMMSMIDRTKFLKSISGRFLITRKSETGETLYYKGFMRGFTSNILHAKCYDSYDIANRSACRVFTPCKVTSVNSDFIIRETRRIWDNI